MRVYNKKVDSDIPDDAVYIGRPSRWGNPFPLHEFKRRDSLVKYEEFLKKKLVNMPNYLEPLRGKDLVCFCHPMPCHGHIILGYLYKDD